MSKPILTSLSPNTEPDDIRLAWQVLLSPWTWRTNKAVTAAEEILSARLNQPVVTTSSGRQALQLLLEAHGIGKGDEVIVQAFTCIAVPEAIIWAGAKPIYADIDATTYNLDSTSIREQLTPRTRAIIVQHTFGIPGCLNELRALCDEHNLILLEDCAHALGATFRNQLVGTFGDSAFFSFGRDKTISSVFGGAVTSKNSSVVNKIQERQSALPYPPRRWVMQQLLHPILMSIIIPTYFAMRYGQAILVLAQQVGLLSKAVETHERTGQAPAHVSWRYSPALAKLLLRQLKKIDRYTTHRRRVADQYMRALAAHKATLPIPSAHSQPNWLRFPIQIQDPQKVYTAARRENIILGDWYNAPLVPGDYDLETFHYTPGSCPRAENSAQHVVNLPTHPRLTLEDVGRVIAVVKKNT